MTIKSAKKPAWFQIKLNKQEEEIKELRQLLDARPAVAPPPTVELPPHVNNLSTTNGSLDTNGGTTTTCGFSPAEPLRGEAFIEAYIKGFSECMSKYAIFAKAQRRRILNTIRQRYQDDHNTAYVRKVK